MRQKIVGEFGLVSFAGFNRSVLAVELLDRPMIDGELSPRFRPLAREIMAQRQRLGMTPAFGPGLYVNLGQYEANFACDLYRIALPTVRRFCGPELAACNRELTDFSREVIGLRKGRCLLWVVESVPRALMKILWFEWILWLLAPWQLGWAARLWLGARARWDECCCGRRFPLSRRLARVLAATYFLADMGLMCLSGTYGDSRLVLPAGVFLPSLLAMLIVGQWEKIGLLRRA